jgi:hypothetical protein
MIYKIKQYVERRRKHSYTNLWERIYGDPLDEGGKGLLREYNFMSQVCGMWANSYRSEELLRKEAEQALTEAGIPIPREVRYDKIMEKYKK